MVFVTEKQAAEYLSLQSETLNRWRWAGKGPRYYRVGGAIRYKLKDLDAFAQPHGASHAA